MQPIDELNTNLQIGMGRINALHTAVLTLFRAMPVVHAARVVGPLGLAAEAVRSDALAMPVPDRLLDEMGRVLGELVEVLRQPRSL